MSQVRVVEELSRIEGSVGWLSMISTAGSFLPAFLEPPAAQRLFGGVESVVAGQVRPPYRADLVEGGYRLSGTYHFGSGCQHASIFTAGCNIYENGELAPPRPSSGVSGFVGARLEGHDCRRVGHHRHARHRQQ
jgi:alkylation response protein AidB-like acyl-CoA dehydrogenase